jgi:hypothetical protein
LYVLNKLLLLLLVFFFFFFFFLCFFLAFLDPLDSCFLRKAEEEARAPTSVKI